MKFSCIFWELFDECWSCNALLERGQKPCILLQHHNKTNTSGVQIPKTRVQTFRGKPLERHLAPWSNEQDFCFTVFPSVPCAKGSLRHLHACSHVGVQNLSPFKTLNSLKDSNPKLGVPQIINFIVFFYSKPSILIYSCYSKSSILGYPMVPGNPHFDQMKAYWTSDQVQPFVPGGSYRPRHGPGMGKRWELRKYMQGINLAGR